MFCIKRIIIILVFLMYSQFVFSQNNDAGLWSTFDIEKSLSKKIAICFEEEIRIKENFSTLNLLNTNAGISLKPSKKFKVSLTYRFISKYLDEGMFGFRHRLMLDMTYNYKLSKKLTVAYRSRLQSEMRNIYSSKTGKIPEWFWRNKFEIKYSINRAEPFVGTEIRYQIRDPRNPSNDLGWHRIRLFGGVGYKISKNNSAGIYYLVQREDGAKDPQNLYIIGLQYSIKFDKN